MCSECRQNPCHPQCPNYEPEVIEVCEECGAMIYESDTYYDISGIILCEDCIDKCKRTAERKD